MESFVFCIIYKIYFINRKLNEAKLRYCYKNAFHHLKYKRLFFVKCSSLRILQTTFKRKIILDILQDILTNKFVDYYCLITCILRLVID